jgi:hypothetical protein
VVSVKIGWQPAAMSAATCWSVVCLLVLTQA